MGDNEAVVFPENFSSLTFEQLEQLQARAVGEFDELADSEELDDEKMRRLEELAAGIENTTTAMVSLQSQAAVTAANDVDDSSNTATRASELRDRVSRVRRPAVQSTHGDDVTNSTPQNSVSEQVVVAGGAKTKSRAPQLSSASAYAPGIPAGDSNELIITAAAATHGMQIGQRITTNDALVAAMQGIARSVAPTHGHPAFQNVASITNHFEYVIPDRPQPGEVDEILRAIRSTERQEALVAGGGWCAPSEIRYDFFNIVCQDGMVDLPTVGIKRGGLQYPVSPSLADVYTGAFTNATNPWLWSEADDIQAATGTSPTKPCVRVTCPSFAESVLECYGICLTAGNLTDYAYPEATRNHLSLLMAAHYHAMNARYLATMEALSTSIGTIPASGTGILSDAPAVTAMAAQDYRTLYGMCDTDIVEVIFPRWVRDAMRIDHLRRNGFWASPLSNADIDKLFTANRVRVQWVNDWQVRGTGEPGNATPITSWPDTVDFMMYAAGTFIRGNGLSLDLGVVRDSVLNETNDHTAAWTEECHLIAMVGHASRLYTIPVCTAGRTGANDVVCSMTE